MLQLAYRVESRWHEQNVFRFAMSHDGWKSFREICMPVRLTSNVLSKHFHTSPHNFARSSLHEKFAYNITSNSCTCIPLQLKIYFAHESEPRDARKMQPYTSTGGREWKGVSSRPGREQKCKLSIFSS